MPPQQRQRLSYVVDHRLYLGLHCLYRSVFARQTARSLLKEPGCERCQGRQQKHKFADYSGKHPLIAFR
jgi:hypothetical protein